MSEAENLRLNFRLKRLEHELAMMRGRFWLIETSMIAIVLAGVVGVIALW